jgi:hypothetical protein
MDEWRADALRWEIAKAREAAELERVTGEAQRNDIARLRDELAITQKALVAATQSAAEAELKLSYSMTEYWEAKALEASQELSGLRETLQQTLRERDEARALARRVTSERESERKELQKALDDKDYVEWLLETESNSGGNDSSMKNSNNSKKNNDININNNNNNESNNSESNNSESIYNVTNSAIESSGYNVFFDDVNVSDETIVIGRNAFSASLEYGDEIWREFSGDDECNPVDAANDSGLDNAPVDSAGDLDGANEWLVDDEWELDMEAAKRRSGAALEETERKVYLKREVDWDALDWHAVNSPNVDRMVWRANGMFGV